MTRTTLGRLGLFLFAVSCNNSTVGPGEPVPTCPEGQVCADPNNPGVPTIPETVTQIGGSGPNSTPFNPSGDGSSGVAVVPGGGIGLDPNSGGSAVNQSVIWVANSADGTVSKLDARTLKQISRYVTYPGSGGDPSRTSVSLNGDVVVANRAWQNGSNGTRASVVYIAGDLSGCVDRNANGKIDTHVGEEIALPGAYQWAAGQAASPDECVVWLADVSKDKNGVLVAGVGSRPRAIGFDSFLAGTRLSKYVYVGLFDTSEVVRLNANTGQIVSRISVAPSQPYGLALDGKGKVWVMGRESEPGTLTSIDPAAADLIKTYPGPTASNGNSCNYGITVDARGLVYTSWMGCVARFDPVTAKFETYVVPNAGRLRGLGLDNKNQLYIADDQKGMHHIDASAAPPASGASTMVARRLVTTAAENVGVAIDFDNKPWVVSTGNVATRVDVANNYATSTHVNVRGSYTYSDMSGYQLRNASRAGTFRNTFNGCGGSNITTWTKLAYTLQAPAGTTATIRYRAAANQVDLVNAMWVSTSGPSPVQIMVPAGVTANYLQVEVNMTSVNATATPVLSELSAGYTCMNIVG